MQRGYTSGVQKLSSHHPCGKRLKLEGRTHRKDRGWKSHKAHPHIHQKVISDRCMVPFKPKLWQTETSSGGTYFPITDTESSLNLNYFFLQRQICGNLSRKFRITDIDSSLILNFFSLQIQNSTTKPFWGARLRGRTATRSSKKGSENVLGKGSEEGFSEGFSEGGLLSAYSKEGLRRVLRRGS